MAEEQLKKLKQELMALPSRLQKLSKSYLYRLPRTDPDCRVLHKRGQSVVGYTGDLAVSEDQFILAQRVTQALPTTRRCSQWWKRWNRTVIRSRTR